MRVVVTGATGNVGTSVVTALAADDRITEIIGMARRLPDWTAPKTRFVALDVATDELTPHFHDVDAVVHLAWLFQPTHRPLVTWQANALGSIRVFRAAVAAGVGALVHASSIGVYSAGPHDDRAVDETWPTDSLPTAAYGREKAYTERVLDAIECEYPGTRVVRMRPAFIFKRAAATEQRRLFVGPFLPNGLVRYGKVPVLPYPDGLRFQAVHTSDVADAYRLAVVRDVRGPFNLAAGPIIDGPDLGELLGARAVAVPRRLLRAVVAAAWHARLVPADPRLIDLFLQLPLLQCTRARTELGWSPAHDAAEAVAELLDGMADGAGAPTPPLAPDSLGRRVLELAGRR